MDGYNQSVYEVILGIVERSDASRTAKERVRVLLHRMTRSMQQVYRYIGVDVETYVAELLSFSERIECLGEDGEPSPVTDNEIHTWMKENGFRQDERYQVCIRTFIQRVLCFKKNDLDLMDKDAFRHLRAFFVLVKKQIETRNTGDRNVA